MTATIKQKIWIVEQSAWRKSHGARPSMPLAAGYLKAMVLADPELDSAFDVRIFSFGGYESMPQLIHELFSTERPAIFAFSVLGWNMRTAERLAAVYRQLVPDGWVVWGGNHVSDQGERLMPGIRDVDVIVNGEGEHTWRELLRTFLAGGSPRALHAVDGLSFRDDADRIVTTKPRPRITNLDEIPSPFLTGAIPLTDAQGAPLYDDALMETNRGCPYKCAFCYWGGAIGQKVRSFSPERLKREVDLIARAGYAKLSLCDANFGMLPNDEEFLEACIEARKAHGYPRYFFTSWAKNKSKGFHRILRRMKEARLTSTFNIALQTLSPTALDLMNRKNMHINQWEPLVEQLKLDGLDLYTELIWGTPGDDKHSFLASYDRLAASVPQVAVYPLLIMPNTDYMRRKKELGLITFRSENHDFELVLSHPTMSAEDNREMQRFLFWARLMGEQAYFRHIWRPVRLLAGLPQSWILLSFDRWIDQRTDRLSLRLCQLRGEIEARLETDEDILDQALRLLYGDPSVDEWILAWWTEAVEAHLPARHQAFLRDVVRLDLATRPRYKPAAESNPQPTHPSSTTAPQFSRLTVRNVPFSFDVVRILDGEFGPESVFVPQETLFDIVFLARFDPEMRLFYEARNKMYFGRVRATVRPQRDLEPLGVAS